MAIREATRDDVPLLGRLIRESFRDVAERLGLTAEEWPRFSAFTADERVASDMGEGTTFYVLENDGAPCGCVGLREREPGVCSFRRLAVLPECRGKGFGTALVEHVVAEAKERGASRIELGMVAQQSELADWYGKLGFAFKETKRFGGMPFAVTFMSMGL
jgi:N-acetylglutamate synthase-like GNAT family acetyltransferase